MTVPILPVVAPHLTPFELVTSQMKTLTARKGLLSRLCHQLETQATNPLDPPVVLATFQRDTFTKATAARYAKIATTSPLVAVFGPRLDSEPAPGVRGTSLLDDDALNEQWVIVIVGAHYASAFLARDLGDTGPDADRRFDYVITHNRDLVVSAGRSLLPRLTES